ncbi:unnamed protein product [Callosobruchus maculatus]|nr:unnamed protein product [Callosobruchus maculatus]
MEPRSHSRTSDCVALLQTDDSAVEMTGNYKILHICLVLFVLAKTLYADEGTKEVINKEKIKKDESDSLVASESKDGQLEIVKRIKKVNRDGSYTIGYEADDGSFKIESRDVLGRIRGTYGYVDENGLVRRVTYDSSTGDATSTANTTEHGKGEEDAATASPITSTGGSTATVVQRIPTKLKRNETNSSTSTVNGSTSTTRRPTYIFSSTVTTPTSTANSVVQSIPRKRTSNTIPSTTTTEPHYEQAVTYSSATPRVLLQGGHQLVRPPQDDEAPIVTVKPIALPLSFSAVSTDEGRESNILRREAGQQYSNSYDVREHVHRLRQSLGHDASDVYSAGSMTTGTPRPPLFTTTHRSAIHAPAMRHSAQAASRQDHSLTTTLRPVTTYKPAVVSQTSATDKHITYAVNNNNEDATPSQSTTTPIPATSIRDPLVAVRQPDGRHAVLIPLSHLQAGYVPILRVHPHNDR